MVKLTFFYLNIWWKFAILVQCSIDFLKDEYCTIIIIIKFFDNHFQI